MSDLAATNCGCGCDGGLRSGGNSCWILILLLFFCNGSGWGMRSGENGCGCGGDCCWILILLLLFCGNNGMNWNWGGSDCGCSNNCGNNCGC